MTFYRLCSCKDRATVRHRPNSKEKKKFQSVSCWSLPPGIWLYLATAPLSCHAWWYGVLRRLGSCLHFSSWQQRLSSWSSALTPSGVVHAFSCTEIFALRPPLNTVGAACAHLLGPCCFLPFCPLLPSLLLAAVQPSPCSGRLFPVPLTELDRRARGTRSQDSQDQQKTNEFKDKPIKRYSTRGERGSHGGRCEY